MNCRALTEADNKITERCNPDAIPALHHTLNNDWHDNPASWYKALKKFSRHPGVRGEAA